MAQNSDPKPSPKSYLPVPGHTHLERRGAVYYFRVVVPPALRPFMDMDKPVTEIRRSLGTKDFEKAKRLCQIQIVAFSGKLLEAQRKLDAKATASPPSEEEILHLVTNWFIEQEREADERRRTVLDDGNEELISQELDSLIDEAELFTSNSELFSSTAPAYLADALFEEAP